ncbi:unnamed protein product [Fusarium graminearum]|uniref:Chromosome 1, complete genome n=1 Tax=Gibberella zeae (strain ATCC MYA-4620 / CBS 123657 / FGSC 9075 / NRRL 31084 / PH-1) TaxID=229533 RepID=A0A098D3I5_GIBZE|nr:unnamed protein product [Fusarium graminearum]CZS76259.1 unnamed protein product [Fusarium graminearum]
MSTRSTKSQATPKSTKCKQKHLPTRMYCCARISSGCGRMKRDPFDQLLALSLFEFIISLKD